MSENTIVADRVATSLPACDGEDDDSDLISLCDIVVTGIETDWSHFHIRMYDPRGDGTTEHPWAILEPFKAGLKEGQKRRPLMLTEPVMRHAVTRYLASRLDRGMDLMEAMKLVDGSYTDAVIADSILQFAVYGEEVFS